MSALKARIAQLDAQIEFDTRLRAELIAVDTGDAVKKAVRSYSGKKRGRKPKPAAVEAAEVNTIEIPEGVYSPSPEAEAPLAPMPEVVARPRRMRAAPSRVEQDAPAAEAVI